MPPQFVKPYVKTNKPDMADAEASCEAVGRPNMRFVSIKNIEQLNRPGNELTPRSWTSPLKGVSMSRYDEQLKLNVVQDYISGAKLLGRKYEIPEEKVRTWVSRYRVHGVNGLRPKRGSCSADFKLEVLNHQEREQLSGCGGATISVIPIKLPSGEKNLTLVVYQRLRINAGGVLR